MKTFVKTTAKNLGLTNTLKAVTFATEAHKGQMRKRSTIPYIYHEQPAEEDRYALFANGAKLITVDASTYLNLKNPYKTCMPYRSSV